MEWSLRVDTIRQYLRESLWFWPTLAVIAALVAGSWLSSFIPTPEMFMTRYVFQGSLSNAQQILSALLGAAITALSVVLSLTVVVLQTASMQFSPRLLRIFIRDGGIQAVLSVFLGTIAYLLAVLHTINTEVHANDVPRLAISGAMGLVLLVIGVLGYFFHHISRAIRVESIMQRITDETLHTIMRMAEPGDPDVQIVGQLPEVPPTSVVVPAQDTGYLQNTDLLSLWPLIAQHHLVVRFRSMPGDPITPGTPLAWVWSCAPDPVLPEPALLSQYLNGAVEVGFARTLRADIAFGFRQLIDIAIKAISPAVNDPYTAVQAIDHLSQLLCRLASRQLGALGCVDAQGRVRIAAPAAAFETYLTLACDQIRRYGTKEHTIVLRLLTMLCDVGTIARPEYKASLQMQVTQVLADADRDLLRADELEEVRTAARLARCWIDGNTTLAPPTSSVSL